MAFEILFAIMGRWDEVVKLEVVITLLDVIALVFFDVEGVTFFTVGLDNLVSLEAFLGLVRKSDIPTNYTCTPIKKERKKKHKQVGDKSTSSAYWILKAWFSQGW